MYASTMGVPNQTGCNTLAGYVSLINAVLHCLLTFSLWACPTPPLVFR